MPATPRPSLSISSAVAAAALLTTLAFAGCSGRPKATALPQPDATLRFVGAGALPGPVSKRQLAAAIPVEVVTGLDPNYGRPKRFRALPLAQVIRHGFPSLQPAGEELLLRALDGYAVPVAAARLFDAAAYLAIADEDHPDWEPIPAHNASPAPFYVIWKGEGRTDLEHYPRPWALGSIERARFEDLYPHVVPPANAAADARLGFAVFRRDCIHCHAMNREGGRVGPELNVPRSIVEYRPVAEIRQYIRDPGSYRYTTMPAHPNLSDAELDGLTAYFRLMSQHKYDPDARPAADGGAR